MAVNLSPIGNGFQFFTSTGVPLAGGLLYTYQAGSSTPLASYTDTAGLFANTNPIVMNADGRPPSEIWLTAGFNYKFVLSTAANVQIASYDNIYGILGTAPSVAVFPSGAIVLWSGSIGSIPAGWYLCDGTNGTPNLKNSFIVGAGDVYPVSGAGGTTDSIVVSHTHTATTSAAGAASGSISGGNGTGDFGSFNAATGVFALSGSAPNRPQGAGGGGSYTTETMTIPDHTHPVTVNTTGVSATNANLPPYYALAYIQKA